jgi:predicted phosphoribosyltransferase
MLFEDRLDAARRLAEALRHHAASRPLVLAIPRGAVPMGEAIAHALGGELDVVLVHKLRAPLDPEFAIGAIDEAGHVYIPDRLRSLRIDPHYVERESAGQLANLKRRRARFTPGRTGVDPAGRVAIVVDDGLATGATMIAALKAVRAGRPGRLVCAVPVAAPSSLAAVEPLADEVVCLHSTPDFHAVSQFYRRFPQVEDEEVVALLAREAGRPVPERSAA